MTFTLPADRFATRAADEAARLAAFEASGPTWAVEARNDPAAGLQFTLETVGPTTVVALHPHQGGPRARWVDEMTLPAMAEWVKAHNRAGRNIYFTPNATLPGLEKKPTKAEIPELRAVFADIDAKVGRTLDQAQSAVLALPTPSFIIASGGGFQPVWLLDSPIQATPEAIAEAERIGRRLATLADGDPVQNVDRILRLPFTLNHPNAAKRKAGRDVSVSGVLRMKRS